MSDSVWPKVVEHFDLEFRILYAQSKPISSKLLSSFRISGRFDHLVEQKPLSRELTLGQPAAAAAGQALEHSLEGRAGWQEAGLRLGAGPPRPPPSARRTLQQPQGQAGGQEGSLMPATQTEPGEEAPAVSTSDDGDTSQRGHCGGTQTTVATGWWAPKPWSPPHQPPPRLTWTRCSRLWEASLRKVTKYQRCLCSSSSLSPPPLCLPRLCGQFHRLPDFLQIH